MNLNDITRDSYERARRKGWWDDPAPNIPEKLALIHSELSEALEEYRNGHNPTEIYHDGGDAFVANGAMPPLNPKPEGFPIELADAIIRICDLAGFLGIDLEAAVALKAQYNETRPVRHGGKLC